MEQKKTNFISKPLFAAQQSCSDTLPLSSGICSCLLVAWTVRRRSAGPQ
jgi:hypothetical protein